MDKLIISLLRSLAIILPVVAIFVEGEVLKVSRCSGEGMDVTLTGPFQGLLTVKGTTCQIEVRLVDSTPIMFFVPYGEKCAIKVDYLGRAMFTLLISEQKSGDLARKIHYDVKERTMLCQYYVNAALNVASDPRLGTGTRSNEIVALERSFYPTFPGVFQSNILQID